MESLKSSSKAAVAVTIVFVLAALTCLAIPMYVIRPFRPQDPAALHLALTVRGLAPWITAACAFFVLLIVIFKWRSARILSRITFSLLTAIALACVVLSHVNIFEVMFHPYSSLEYVAVSDAKIDTDDKVLAVRIGNEARAYPIRTMGYHHIVNDTVGDQPIAVSYCTLCHTGIVWNRILNGRTLRFRLAGINNGNALLRDEETGSIWQQSTGQAIFGPLTGSQLSRVPSDELSFAIWKKEQPDGQVLKADAPYADEYDPKDWEAHVEKTHVVIDTSKSGIQPHELMLGVAVNGEYKAYPVKTILNDKLIEDKIAGQPILILVGEDKTSIRVFGAKVPGDPSHLTFTRSPDQELTVDAESGSHWNFEGRAVDGKYKGLRLLKIESNKDYWFDWMNHHPQTSVFKG
jgi:hypothetical protein